MILLTSCNGQNSTKNAKHNSNVVLGDTVSELSKSIWIVFQAANGDYWYGSDKDGVFRFDGKTIINFSTKDGLSSNRVRGIQEDKQGNIYISTLEGINKFDGHTFTTLTAIPSIASNDNWKLQPDDLWFSILGKDGENGPYVESDKPNPLSYYAKSKLASEELIDKSGYSKTAVARTIIVFGTGDKLSRGNLIFWAKGALKKQSPINVVDDQFRSPSLAEDLAKGCIAIADNEATGIYHLSGPETMSILEIVERIGKYYDLSTDCVTPIKTATLNQTAARPPRTGFIIKKAQQELDYNPMTLEESLEFLDNQI